MLLHWQGTPRVARGDRAHAFRGIHRLHLLPYHSSALGCCPSSAGLGSSSSILSTSASGTCSFKKSIIVCVCLCSRNQHGHSPATARARLKLSEQRVSAWQHAMCAARERTCSPSQLFLSHSFASPLAGSTDLCGHHVWRALMQRPPTSMRQRMNAGNKHTTSAHATPAHCGRD